MARRVLPQICVGIFCATVGLYGYYASHHQVDSRAILNTVWTIVSLWAAVSCFQTARSVTERSPRLAWLLTAVACASWFVGQVLWDFQEWIKGHLAPFAGWQDLAFLATGPLLLAAFHFFSDREAQASHGRKACNLGIIACSAAVIGVLLCGRSLLTRHEDPAFIFSVLGWGILMPTTFVGGLLCLWLYCSTEQLRPLTLLVAAAGVEAVANVQYAYACAVEEYRPGIAADWLFAIGFLLIVWAASVGRKVRPLPYVPPRRRVRFDQLEPALPAFCMLAMLTAAIWRRQALDDLFPYLLPLLILLALCIAVREAWSAHVERGLNQQLRSSEAMLRQVVESNLGGIFFAELNGRVTYANDTFLQIAGYSREELEAGLLHWDAFTAADEINHDGLSIAQLRERGSCEPFERKFRRRDGTEIPVLLGAAFLPGTPPQAVCFAADLSAHKHTERALEATQARLAAALDHLPFAFWAMDEDGRYAYQNAVSLERWGDQRGKRTDEVNYPEEVVKQRMASYARAFAGEIVKEDATTGEGADRYWYQRIIVPIRQNSKVCGIFGVNVDLTEQKQAQLRLEESERRFRAMVENASDGTAVWDRHGIILYAAPSNLRLLGYASEEMVGRNVIEFMHPDDAPGVQEILANALRTPGAHLPLQGRVRHKQGGWRYCEGLLTNLLEDPAVAALVLNYDDCTERHEAEQALRLSEERYRSLIDGARDAIFTISPEGLLTSLNPGAELITGVPNAERLGKPFLPLIPPEDAGRALEAFHKTLAGEKIPTLELHVHGARGPVLFEFTITPQFDAGRIIGILGIGRDISERRTLEEQLRHSQKMESVGQLAGGVAHDFNNLLTVIQGNASLIELEPNLNPSIALSVKEITEATDRAASLTRQLLTFSRRQIIRPRNLNLGEVIGDLTKMLRRILGEDIALQFESSPNLPPIHADAGMMEQALLNLAVNARDAMPTGGHLTIRTSCVQIGEEEARKIAGARAGSFVKISVRDSGCGIAPEDLPHVFEPFFTTKDVGQGTGLGLATVYGIVQQHDGWIRLESTRGEGTCFDIFVPAADPVMEPKSDSASPAATMPRGTETILIVEDEAPLRSMVRTVLSRLGYRVIEAASGVEALELWKEHREQIDLVFTDMVMPDGLSGQQLAEKLQSDRPGLRLLFTSGYSSQMLTRNGRLPDGALCLQKPYMPPALAAAIRDAITAPVQQTVA